MDQMGALGTIDKFDDNIFGGILQLGLNFGQFEALFQDDALESPSLKPQVEWDDFIQEINTRLDILQIRHRMNQYDPQANRRRQKVFLANDYRQIQSSLKTISQVIYFVIGTAAGLMISGAFGAGENRCHAMQKAHDKKTQGDYMEVFQQLKILVKTCPSDDVDTFYPPLMGMLTELHRAITILFVAADNHYNLPLSTQDEFKAIAEALHNYQKSGKYHLMFGAACDIESFALHLTERNPRVVHFAGHGDSRGILLQSKDGHGHYVPLSKLSAILKNAVKDGLKTIFLNSCDSHAQSESLAKYTGVQNLISIKGNVVDTQARQFSKSFYQNLAMGKNVTSAFNNAKSMCDITANQHRSIEPVLIRHGVRVQVQYDSDVEIIEASEEGPEPTVPSTDPPAKSPRDSEHSTLTPPNSQMERLQISDGATTGTSHNEDEDSNSDASSEVSDTHEGSEIATKRPPPSNEANQPQTVQRAPSSPGVNARVVEIEQILRALLQNNDFLALGQIWRERNSMFDPTVKSWLHDPKKIPMLQEMSKVPHEIVHNVWKSVAVSMPAASRVQSAPQGFVHSQQQQQRQQQFAARRPANPFNDFDDFFNGFFDDVFTSSFGRSPFALNPFGPGPLPLVTRSVPSYKNPFADLTCRQCDEPFGLQGGARCTICEDGCFDVCARCTGNGIGCLRPREHSLRKWIVKRNNA